MKRLSFQGGTGMAKEGKWKGSMGVEGIAPAEALRQWGVRGEL